MPAVDTGRSIAELSEGMTKMPQVMVNVAVVDPAKTAQCDALRKAIGAKEAALANRGRVLVRPSGTEPLLRVMVEGENAEEVRDIANELAYVAEHEA